MHSVLTAPKAKRPKQLKKLISDEYEAFPDVRYFQIHFEHLHECLSNTLVKIEALNKQVNQLEKRLAASLKQNSIPVDAMTDYTNRLNNHLPLNDSDHSINHPL